MWLWLLIQTALLQSADLTQHTSAVIHWILEVPGIQNVNAAETSTGPTSPEEASVLWNDGKSAFDAEDYAKSIPLFQRLVDRYPGSSGYLEAHRFLGRAYLLNDRAKDSIDPLRYYISAASDRELSVRTRVWLAEAYLATDNPREAYLSSLEIEKSPSADPQTFAEGELMKAQVLIALKQQEKAQKVLDAVKQKPILQTDPLLIGQAAHVELQLKVHDCGKPVIPQEETPNKASGKKGSATGPSGMDELKVQDAYARRAVCLQEALVLVRHVLDASGTGKDLMTVNEAQSVILRGFEQYNRSILNPPPAVRASAQTAKQKKQYREELVDHLQIDRKKTYDEANTSLLEWKKEASAISAPAYDQLAQKLQTLSKAAQL
jgi:TolA-binding protein